MSQQRKLDADNLQDRSAYRLIGLADAPRPHAMARCARWDDLIDMFAPQTLEGGLAQRNQADRWIHAVAKSNRRACMFHAGRWLPAMELARRAIQDVPVWLPEDITDWLHRNATDEATADAAWIWLSQPVNIDAQGTGLDDGQHRVCVLVMEDQPEILIAEPGGLCVRAAHGHSHDEHRIRGGRSG